MVEVGDDGVNANDRELCRLILEKSSHETDDKKQSYMHQDKTVHTLVKSGITYIALCSGDVERRIPFMYLLRLEKEVSQLLGDNDRELQDLDKSDLKRRMSGLIQDVEGGKNEVGELGKEIDQVRNIMVENVERLLERGERINLLVSKTDRMNNSSLQFRRRTVSVKRKFWWKNIKLLALLIIVAMGIAYLLSGKLNKIHKYSVCFIY